MGRDALKDTDDVLIESMGFMWVLPWGRVKKDVESGFSTLIEKKEDKKGVDK